MQPTVKKTNKRDPARRAVDAGLMDTVVNGESGTTVVMGPFSKNWFRGLGTKSIANEIQRHFESLLARPNLTVEVTEIGKKGQLNRTQQCLPFDYGAVDGTHIARSLPIGATGLSVECRMVVGRHLIPGKKVRFFKHGRCISQVSEMKSFMQVSKVSEKLWDHPGLCGYIEVGSLLEPVITRDEFTKTRNRAAVYAALLPLEREVQMALDSALVAQADESLSALEDVLQNSLLAVEKSDGRTFSSRASLESGLLSESSDHEGGTTEPLTVKNDVAVLTPIKKSVKRSASGEVATATRERTAKAKKVASRHMIHLVRYFSPEQ